MFAGPPSPKRNIAPGQAFRSRPWVLGLGAPAAAELPGAPAAYREAASPGRAVCRRRIATSAAAAPSAASAKMTTTITVEEPLPELDPPTPGTP